MHLVKKTSNMKKLIVLVTVSLLFACDPSNDGVNPPDETSNFEITVSATNAVVIDETFIINVTSNEPMTSLEVSTDNFTTSNILLTNFGTGKVLNYSFDTLGNKTVSVRAKTAENNSSTKTFSVSVTRGNALKINSLQLVSFHDINNTWDPEFSGTDALADPSFLFQKPKIHVFNDNFGHVFWYQSPVLLNQGSLTWDFSLENLYIDPNIILQFSLVDDDGNFIQDLLLGPPSERPIAFSDYIATQPSTITITIPSINLEMILSVEWP